MRKAFAYIDLNAIRHNCNRVRQCCPEQKIMAMIKAEAYGHGLIPVAQALEDVDALGVTCIQEGIQLRQVGIEQPVILTSGFHAPDQIPWLFSHRLTPVIHSWWQIDALEHYSRKISLDIWLKFDIGMCRLGFSPQQLPRCLSRLEKIDGIDEIVLMSHLSCANELESDLTQRQIALFHQTTQDYHYPLSLANSAAILAWPEAVKKTHWVRPGIMLYGASPFKGYSAQTLGLKLAMHLNTEVIALYDVKPGQVIGYGATFESTSKMKIAIAAMGYADGYPREALKASVCVRQKLCPIVGRVSMDLMTIDVSQVPDISVGEKVILWNERLSVDQVAKDMEQFNYVLLTQVSQRVIRHYLHQKRFVDQKKESLMNLSEEKVCYLS